VRGLLLALPLAGCVFVGQPPQTAPVPPVTVHVDGLYGGRSAGSEWNREAAHERLAARVLLEAAALRPHDDDSGVEAWTLSLLLGRLGGGGAEILMEPLPPVPPPTVVLGVDGSPVPLAAPAPSMALRNLRFLSGREDFAAIVTEQPDGSVRVGARHLPTEDSLCGADWAVPLGFVLLRGALQRWPRGEVAAIWDEVAIVPPPATTSATLALPATDDPAFCVALRQALAGAEALQPDAAAYLAAANAVLDAAVGPLLPVPD
jgi:hypothetical protein